MDPVHSVFLHTRVERPDVQRGVGPNEHPASSTRPPRGSTTPTAGAWGEHVWVRVHQRHPAEPHPGRRGALDERRRPPLLRRPVFTRWVVPVDDRNTRVLAWANFGPRTDEARAEWMTPEGIEIIEGGEPRTRPRAEAIRKPGDYEAFVSMGANHAPRPGAPRDLRQGGGHVPAAPARRHSRRGRRGLPPGPPGPRARAVPTYAGDHVLRIPPRSDDDALVAGVCRQVGRSAGGGGRARGAGARRPGDRGPARVRTEHERSPGLSGSGSRDRLPDGMVEPTCFVDPGTRYRFELSIPVASLMSRFSLIRPIDQPLGRPPPASST